MKKSKRPYLTSVQIRPPIAEGLNRLAKTGMSKSEIINEALRRYLIQQELESVRNQLTPYGQALGLYTDEDVERFLDENRS